MNWLFLPLVSTLYSLKIMGHFCNSTSNYFDIILDNEGVIDFSYSLFRSGLELRFMCVREPLPS